MTKTTDVHVILLALNIYELLGHIYHAVITLCFMYLNEETATKIRHRAQKIEIKMRKG